MQLAEPMFKGFFQEIKAYSMFSKCIIFCGIKVCFGIRKFVVVCFVKVFIDVLYLVQIVSL